MNTHEITLDVSKEPSHEPTLYLGQGDMNGTTLVVNMFDNGEVLDLTGLSVKFCMRTPDMLEFYEVAGTASGNVATFQIDETYAAGHPGSTDIAYVQVIDGDTESTSTARMRVVVLPSAKEGVDPAPAYKELIDEFIEENQEAVDEIIEAAQEVLDDGIPLMTSTRRGGAMLGTGLDMTGEVLSVDVSAAGGIPASQKGAANGVAELDQNGLVLSSQLPSYVDDVLEYASTSQFPTTGESGKIYVATNTNLTYRWTGSAYTEISPSLALGETSSTAYRGDRGAAAYAHAVTNKGAAFSSNLYKITTNSEGHVTAATAATSADIIAFLNNQAITPASVTASGTIQGDTISDGVGTLAQLRDSVSPEEVTITKNYPSGITGNIYCYRIGALALVQFDGFKCSSTTWQYSIASGFPQPSVSKWFTLNSDTSGPVKMYVSSAGVLNVRCTQNNGSEHLVDSITVYPII